MNTALLNEYFSWYNSNFIVNGHEVITPFIDSHNDLIHFFVTEKNQEYILSDNGYTLSNLQISGFSFTEGRERILETIVNNYDIEIVDNEYIQMVIGKNDFPIKFHNFISALIEIDNMNILSQQNIHNLFREDVERFFVDKKIAYKKNIRKIGVSGFEHYFDFEIEKTERESERIIRVLGSIDTKTIQSALFSWNDIKEYTNGRKITILNDRGRRVNNKIINAFRNYDVIPIEWANRNNIIDLLSA